MKKVLGEAGTQALVDKVNQLCPLICNMGDEYPFQWNADTHFPFELWDAIRTGNKPIYIKCGDGEWMDMIPVTSTYIEHGDGPVMMFLYHDEGYTIPQIYMVNFTDCQFLPNPIGPDILSVYGCTITRQNLAVVD